MEQCIKQKLIDEIISWYNSIEDLINEIDKEKKINIYSLDKDKDYEKIIKILIKKYDNELNALAEYHTTIIEDEDNDPNSWPLDTFREILHDDFINIPSLKHKIEKTLGIIDHFEEEKK